MNEQPDSRSELPRILVVNDDHSLLQSRRLLLEDCGALVVTARGEQESIAAVLREKVDLVVIDATNVGLEHATLVSKMVRSIRPEMTVALLVKKEMGAPPAHCADRVIFRTGPRRILVELNELLNGRLDLNLWDREGLGDVDEEEDTVPGR